MGKQELDTSVQAHSMRKKLRRQAMQFSGLFCGLLFCLTLVLIIWRVEQMLTTLAQDRTDRIVRQLVEEGEGAMRLGIDAGDLQFYQERLERLRQDDPGILLAFVETRTGEAVAESGDRALRRLIDPRWIQRLMSGGRSAASELRHLPAHTISGATLFDPTGSPVASLWLVASPEALRIQARSAAQAVVLKALPLAVLSCLVLYLAMHGWARRSIWLVTGHTGTAGSRRARRAAPLMLAALLLASPAMIWIAREAARPYVSAQIESSADMVAASVAGQVQRALQLGVPLQSLNGLPALFADRLAVARELSWLALRGPDGQELAHAGTSHPDDIMTERSAPVGGSSARIVAAYSHNYVDRALGAMLLDLVLAVVISVVLLRELTRGLWRRSLLHPLLDYRIARVWWWIDGLRGRKPSSKTVEEARKKCKAELSIAASGHVHGEIDSGGTDFGVQLTRLRLAVFLIALSDELLRPFFTAFASEMQTSSAWLSPAMLAGLPVVAFMCTLALSQIIGPMLAQRFDLRRMLMLAAPAGALALVGTAFTHDVGALVLLRSVSGAAYGLGLILVQTAIVRHAPPAQRARSLAEVAAAIVAAGIVGPPFGGMLSGRIGDAHALLACALAMIGAHVVASRLRLSCTARGAETLVTTTAPTWRGYLAVLHNWRAMCVILGSALPARLVAVTVLVVVAPLYVRQLELSADAAGRVMLMYFLCFAATASLMAHWSDLLGQRKPFIVAGCLVAAVACLQLPAIQGIGGLALCCALLGVGQAVQSSPQITLVTELFERKDASVQAATPEQALAAFRLIERGGSIIAPFVTALAIALLGLEGAVAAVGVLLALGALGVWLGLRPSAPLAISARS